MSHSMAVRGLRVPFGVNMGYTELTQFLKRKKWYVPHAMVLETKWEHSTSAKMVLYHNENISSAVLVAFGNPHVSHCSLLHPHLVVVGLIIAPIVACAFLSSNPEL